MFPPRGINRASHPRLPSAPVSKCEVVHTERCTPCLIIANSISCNPPLAGGDRMKFDQIKRREFMTLLGTAAAWPLAAGAQQPGRPLGGLLQRSPIDDRQPQRAPQGVSEAAYCEGRNIAIK